jgi:hypothetical protein
MLPAPVDQRFEFLSAGWTNAARNFITQFVKQHPELRDATYSMCEAFEGRAAFVGRGQQPRRLVLADCVMARSKSALARSPTQN